LTPVLVDSSLILDLTTRDPTWGDWSRQTLTTLLNETRLVINPIVYAEVSVDFAAIEALDEALPVDLFEREPLPYAAGFLAGRACLAYRRRGGTRTAPMPDFYIGAHAAIRGYAVATRDPRRIAGYFPTVRLVTPESPEVPG
jgi:predicted nucleic acid-binding protein